MFNPNSNSQMLASVADDLGYLGLIVADRIERPDWAQCTVGNESITFATLTFINGGCGIRGCNSATFRRVTYKGSLEQLSQDVIARVVKMALAHRCGGVR